MQGQRTHDVVHLINRDAREQEGCRDEVRKRMYSSLIVLDDFSLDSKMRLVRLSDERQQFAERREPVFDLPEQSRGPPTGSFSYAKTRMTVSIVLRHTSSCSL